jgi:dipeptidase E
MWQSLDTQGLHIFLDSMSKGHIIITGGGDQSHVRRLNQRVCSMFSASGSARLLVIPFALDVEDYDDVIDYVDETIGAGFSEIDFLESVEKAGDIDFAKYNLVYIHGGNTFDLLQRIFASGLSQKLKSYYLAGGSIYGDSAGAIILGASAQTAYFGDEPDDNQCDLSNLNGLDLLNSWSVHCHYKVQDDDECQDYMYAKGSPVIMLAEEAGVIISPSDEVEVFGEAPTRIMSFSGKEVFKPSSRFELASLTN